MELNAKKCKEIIIDFRKGKINIPQLKIEGQPRRSSEVPQIVGDQVGRRFGIGQRILNTLPKRRLNAYILVKNTQESCLVRLYGRLKSILLCYNKNI